MEIRKKAKQVDKTTVFTCVQIPFEGRLVFAFLYSDGMLCVKICMFSGGKFHEYNKIKSHENIIAWSYLIDTNMKEFMKKMDVRFKR